jgi:hypothetical protein
MIVNEMNPRAEAARFPVRIMLEFRTILAIIWSIKMSVSPVQRARHEYGCPVWTLLR